MNTLPVFFERAVGSLSGVLFLLPLVLVLIVAVIALKSCARTRMTFLTRFFSFSLETEKSQAVLPRPAPVDEATKALSDGEI